MTFSLAAIDNVENLTLIGISAINGTGNSLANVLTGNGAANTLDGGAGNDTLTGGAGVDTFIVASGTDSITDLGQGGADVLTVAADAAVNATVTTAWTATSSTTNSGTANINANGFAVSLAAATGNGFNITNTGAATTLTGSGLADSLTGGGGNDILIGGAGNNTLAGGAGNDSLTGGLGIDTFTIGSGTDTITDLGQGGADILTVASLATANATVTTAWTATVGSTNAGTVNITTAGFAVNLAAATGSAGYSVTTSAATTLTGSIGNDSLTGGTGNDTLVGGLGNDTLTGGAGNDTLTGGAGVDTFTVGSGTDTITDLGNGQDILKVSASAIANATVTTAWTATSSTTNSGTANISTSGLVVNLTAITTGANGYKVTNTGVATTLTGSSLADTLISGLGNDTYYVDATDDVVTEGVNAGTDTISASVSYTLAANVENLTLTGTSAINGTGNSLANILTGNSGANTLDGGAGTDSLTGGGGNDIYIVDSTTDIITELTGGGTDTIQSSVTYSLVDTDGAGTNGGFVENLTLTGSNAINGTGNALNNVLTGNSGANTLNGGAGNDTLVGGLGNDTLTGGRGADSLTGGLGKDTFVFTTGDSGQTTNYDIISDYFKGVVGTGDLIDFSANLTRGGAATAAIAAQAAINQTTGIATFAAGSGTTLSDALSDIATRFTTATNTLGEFSFFQVNNTGDYYLFISDGTAGVTANDDVIQLVGVSSISSIDLTGGNLTITG